MVKIVVVIADDIVVVVVVDVINVSRKHEQPLNCNDTDADHIDLYGNDDGVFSFCCCCCCYWEVMLQLLLMLMIDAIDDVIVIAS